MNDTEALPGTLDVEPWTKPRASGRAHLVILHSGGDRYPRTVCNVEVSDAWVRADPRRHFLCHACQQRLAFLVDVMEWWGSR